MKEIKETSEILYKQGYQSNTTLNMVAPCNVAPRSVLKMMGSCFNEVAAEGYRGDRYHTGTENYDALERLGEKCARETFNVHYVNLKPHSGTQAVQGALLALKKGGRNKILSMDVKEGGHITHRNVTDFNKAVGFDFAKYGVNDEGELDYDAIEKSAEEYRPEIIIAGGSAFPGKIDWKAFREIADRHDAKLVADISHYAGLVAGGVYPSPAKDADIIVSSTSKTLPGPKGGMILIGRKDEDLERRVNRAVNIGLQSEDISNGLAGKVQVLALTRLPEFKQYAQRVIDSAKHLASCFMDRGIPVVGYNESNKGTDSHLVLINVNKYNPNLNGNEAAELLAQAGIYTNMNLIHNDPLSSKETSGVRFGTAALAILDVKDNDIENITKIVKNVLDSYQTTMENKVIADSREKVKNIREKYQETVFDKLNGDEML